MHVRSLLAVALAAVLAGPAAAHAQSKKSSQKAAPATAPAQTSSPSPSSPSPSSTVSLGGWIGYEMGDLDGLQLRLDAVVPFQKLAPQVELSFVGSIGYSYLTHSQTFFGIETKTTANVLKFVPAARFTVPVSPQLSFYGDAGLGLYWASVGAKSGGTDLGSNSDVGFMFRFGVGGFYRLNPKTQLGLSIYLDPMLGSYDDTTFTVLAGALFAL